MLSVGKYFHPDNMSSAEKLKLELAKVRDEFKMSESDCGSARVQGFQLTCKQSFNLLSPITNLLSFESFLPLCCHIILFLEKKKWHN
ncbi:uncharacterized protein LOC103927438 isoform X2 [Pyrus x bretschneideri]|uniref:uncharacterized protein LOC103927438 isoform X2 n=1 Tax=Pyrus x bretschneideri TaxID=225117 RepID=UPI00202E2F64|nr:uncharacterized protein LOC103927438 isoform X2 [Pyrus x bretschneideri]